MLYIFCPDNVTTIPIKMQRSDPPKEPLLHHTLPADGLPTFHPPIIQGIPSHMTPKVTPSITSYLKFHALINPARIYLRKFIHLIPLGFRSRNKGETIHWFRRRFPSSTEEDPQGGAACHNDANRTFQGSPHGDLRCCRRDGKGNNSSYGHQDCERA